MINLYEVRGDETVLIILTKDRKTEIEAIIDTNDLKMVSQMRNTWHLNKNGYVICKFCSRTISLQRWIMGEPKGLVVDHVNNNPLDNRKGNLRAIKNRENLQNRAKPNKNNTSGTIGVSWNSEKNRWSSGLIINGKMVYLGYFKDKEAAVSANLIGRAKYLPYSKEAEMIANRKLD